MIPERVADVGSMMEEVRFVCYEAKVSDAADQTNGRFLTRRADFENCAPIQSYSRCGRDSFRSLQDHDGILNGTSVSWPVTHLPPFMISTASPGFASNETSA